MKSYPGRIVNRGIGVAKAFVLKSDVIVQARSVEEPGAEAERLKAAIPDVIASLEHLKEVNLSRGGEGGEIIGTHILLLGDQSAGSLVGRALEIIEKEKLCAEAAVQQAANAMAEAIVAAATESEQDGRDAGQSNYLSARSEDMLHLGKMMVRSLAGIAEETDLEEPSIIVTDELSPEQLTSFEPEKVIGIVTAKGSPLSHTAILAKNMNVPYLTGVKLDSDQTDNGAIVVIDAENGTFICEPDEKTVEEFAGKAAKLKEEALSQKANAKELIAASPVKLFANIGSPEEAETAQKSGAEGIGLFRSEFLYMSSDVAPDEERQYQAYVKAADAMQGKPVIVRTIDIGADKEARSVPMPKEANPALGTRGIRISFANPELFTTQIRALLRASYKRQIKVMFPMISSEWEVKKAKEFVGSVAKELEQEGVDYAIPSIGIMVETPAAVLTLDSIAPLIDFVSIGTNDLTQYTIALDRVGDGLAEYYDPHHEAVLKLIEMTAETAHRHGVEVGICGELGGDTELAELFIRIGIDELSMSPAKLPAMAAALGKAAEDRKDGALPAVGTSPKETAAPAEGRANQPGNILAPVGGELIPMEEIPDEVFSKGMMGPCLGIDPEEGRITAPFNGVVTMVAETKHALSIRSEEGEEILIHVGIDTVEMNGKGFEPVIKEGQNVKCGDDLMTFSIEEIRNAGFSPIVVVVRISTKG